MSTPPGGMSFWSQYASDLTGPPVRHRPRADSPLLDPPRASPHTTAELAALAAMTPEARAAFVERFNADAEVWATMRANAAQRHTERAQDRLEKSDTGVDGFLPLPPVEGPTPGADYDSVSDAQWAEQNRRMNDILSGRAAHNSPQGETP